MRREEGEGQKAEGGRQNGDEHYSARVVGGEVAADLFERGLCLPSGTAMTGADQDRVISVVRSCRR